MTSVEFLDEHRLESLVPMLRDDVVIRHYGQESVVCSPSGEQPTYLDPVGSIVLQLLDGEASMAELADDICAAVGVPRSIAFGRLRTVVGQLDVVGALTTSDTPLRPADDFFYGPPNP
jgi:hypothetical protein